jgi:hypothetical protein
MELVLSKAFWALWRIGIPFYVWGNPTGSLAAFWTLFFLGEFITGYYLAFNFQVSHVSTHCDYPIGNKQTPTIADEWAVSQVCGGRLLSPFSIILNTCVLQVKSSVDYSHGKWLTTFLCGALNYQV